MRFVILGAGAIGGVVGARLHQRGANVILVARGAHHAAIAARGLQLETPEERVSLPIPVVASPSAVELADDDVVLLTTKSQDSAAAIDALSEVAPSGVAVICLQNGVENERLALRHFENVYGAAVIMPTAHLEPGVVQAYGTTFTGAIDVGRAPHGLDGLCSSVCDELRGARFDSQPRADIMRIKHGKLVANVANAVQAICGTDQLDNDLVRRAREEAEAVFRTAGIPAGSEDGISARRAGLHLREIEGRAPIGGSTWQSIKRNTGSVETDYLNGEIVLQGRLAGVPTPVNALLQALVHETVRGGHQPGWLTPDAILARL